jgi:hypothetical protein
LPNDGGMSGSMLDDHAPTLAEAYGRESAGTRGGGGGGGGGTGAGSWAGGGNAGSGSLRPSNSAEDFPALPGGGRGRGSGGSRAAGVGGGGRGGSSMAARLGMNSRSNSMESFQVRPESC